MLLLIMVPSVVLAVVSWRAIQNERSRSLERLQASHRQFATLAARQIDYQLGTLESRWIGEFEALLGAARVPPSDDELRAAEAREPLISGFFLLTAPGRILYPPGLEREDLAMPDDAARAAGAPEHVAFTRAVARGEDLEYGAGDLKGAIAIYREILTAVENPRLHAMALSYIGRAQLKGNDWTGALTTFRDMLDRYPEVRDLNRMYLRFLAQYQTAIALEGLGRPLDALETLRVLNHDLLSRSDAITTLQYSYYTDLIHALLPRLLGASPGPERERLRQAFLDLGARTKQEIGGKYFVHLLDTELSEMSFRQKGYSPGIRYMTDRTEGVPFLLAYRALPDESQTYAVGILAATIDLERLQEQLFGALRTLNADADGALAILGSGGSVVIGAAAATGTLMASQALASPFDSWQVAVYLKDVPTAMRRMDFRDTLWLWLISVMVLSILVGGYLFILRMQRATQLARAQTTFVSNVTHELRTPLASIRLFAELLELQHDTPDAARPDRPRRDPARYLAIIRQECDRLNRLIDRVLDFSRMERDVKAYRFEPHDVGAAVTAVVESFRPYAETRGFVLDLAVDRPLPPARIDADAIAQVLLNLLSNATQYSRDQRWIGVSVRRSGASIAIEVADHGAGIAPGDLDRVFEKFYSTWRRMDDRNQGGLGLGLTLSREIVWAHGGDITVRSTPGQGSTFTVTLPAAGGEAVVELAPRTGRAPDPADPVARLGGQHG